MANNSLNDLSSVSNTDKFLDVSIEILPAPISNQQIVEDSNTCEQHFNFLAKKFENKIIIWIEKNAMRDFFSYLDCKAVLERFTDDFDILFNNLICEWVARNGMLTKEAEGFDLFKALKKVYISLNKKYRLKLKNVFQVAKLEYGYAMDDEAPEPDGY